MAAVEVDTWTELQAVGGGAPATWTLGADYELTSDLLTTDADYSTINGSGASSFDPIGDVGSEFTGTFDGQNHTIEGLVIDRGAENYVGLFGKISGATISNVNVKDADIISAIYSAVIAGSAVIGSTITNCNVVGGSVAPTADSYAAGISGTTGNSDIISCKNSAAVTTTNTFAGGITGFVYNSGSITSCFNYGDITGARYTGGIAGRSESSTVNNCGTENCTITGTDGDIGGIVGSADVSSAVINVYCPSSVTVKASGSDRIGGLVGTLLDSSTLSRSFSMATVNNADDFGGGLAGQCRDGDIDNCFAGGSVTADAHLGGLVGYLTNGGTIDKCYAFCVVTGGANNGDIVGWDNQGGGATAITDCFYLSGMLDDAIGNGGNVANEANTTGKTAAQLRALSTFIDTGTAGLSSAWDFYGTLADDAATNDYWSMNAALNNGYPYLTNLRAHVDQKRNIMKRKPACGRL